MSAAAAQIRVALEGLKDGLDGAALFAKCATSKPAFYQAIGKMKSAGELVKVRIGEAMHFKLTGKTTGERSAPPQRRRKVRQHAKKARRARRAYTRRSPANGHGKQFLPTITADNRLVLVGPKGPAQVFGAEDTESIAQLMLANFTPD